MKGQFSAQNASRSVRQAAKFNGLATMGSFDVVSHVSIRDRSVDADLMDRVAIRAYSPTGKKVVDITADDLYTMQVEYQDAPMARIS